ncbi:protein angel homolog 1 isoform X2 [Osmerus eperlanus]|uniref:protein angel homolog 1 isoform X2 n=1 Tax=Osmerus eperlanus TaxID=29151 RepID=UPI002E12F969
MIGTIIFFGLYPLTRFINRVSETVKKSYSPVLINGGGLWDGEVGVPTRRFTKTQTSLLDMWISGTVKAKKETREMLNEGEPGTEEKNGIKEIKNGIKEEKNGIKEEKARPAMEEEENPVKPEMEDRLTEKSEVQVAKQEDADVITELQEGRVGEEIEDTIVKVISEMLTMDTAEETELVSMEECNNSGQAQESLVKTPELPNGDQNQSVIDNTTEESGASLLDLQVDMLLTVNKAQVQEGEGFAQIKVFTMEEHWDEYIDTDALYSGTCGPGTDLRPRDRPSQPHQAGWHFPIGPGLGEVVYCPAWQFPAMSYYPTVQETMPFEVMWRVWEQVQAPPASDSRPVFDFTVMSYNILAQDLLETNQHLYSHCPLEALQWDYRFHNLLQELQKWEPDILCLQEVQESHYEQHLEPALTDMGYTCVFKRRTGAKTDGCAVCYRSDRFSQQSVSLLELLRPQCPLLDRDNVAVVLLLQPVITQGSEVTAKGPPLCVANTHLLFNPSRGDVKLAQLALLMAEIDRVVEGCKALGNPCHVILCGDFNSLPNMPLYQLITRGQLHYHGLPAWMVSGQEDMSFKAPQRRLYAPLWPSSLGVTDHCRYASGPASPERPCQEAGGVRYSHDFLLELRFCEAAFVRPQNLELIPGVTDSTPGTSLSNPPGNLPGNSPGNTTDPEATQQQSLSPSFRNTIDHSLTLRSVYRHVLPGSDRPEVTTLHCEVGATVDYIFYMAGPDHRGCHQGGGQPAGSLKLVRRLSLLSEEDLWSMNGLPNQIFPSDHLSLLARFHLEVPPEVPPGGSTWTSAPCDR